MKNELKKILEESKDLFIWKDFDNFLDLGKREMTEVELLKIKHYLKELKEDAEDESLSDNYPAIIESKATTDFIGVRGEMYYVIYINGILNKYVVLNEYTKDKFIKLITEGYDRDNALKILFISDVLKLNSDDYGNDNRERILSLRVGDEIKLLDDNGDEKLYKVIEIEDNEKEVRYRFKNLDKNAGFFNQRDLTFKK